MSGYRQAANKFNETKFYIRGEDINPSPMDAQDTYGRNVGKCSLNNLYCETPDCRFCNVPKEMTPLIQEQIVITIDGRVAEEVSRAVELALKKIFDIQKTEW